MDDKKQERAEALRRIGEMLAQLPDDEIEPTILHLMGVVSGVRIATELRKSA